MKGVTLNHCDKDKLPDLALFTRVLHEGPTSANGSQTTNELIVLVPPSVGHASAVLALQSYLAALPPKYLTVRVVIRGAAGFAFHRPTSNVRVLCSEWDAYQPRQRAPFGEHLVADTTLWLNDLLAGACGSLDASQVFWGSAMLRTLSAGYLVAPVIAGLLCHHPDADFHCLEPNWVGLATLSAFASQHGTRVTPTPSHPPLYSAKLTGSIALHFVAVALTRLVERAREVRLPHIPASPATWISVVANSASSSRHLVHSSAVHSLPKDAPLGVLLQGSLSAEQTKWDHTPNTMGSRAMGSKAMGSRAMASLPGLSELSVGQRALVVEQISSASTRDFAKALWRTAKVALRATRVLLQQSSTLKLGGFHFPLGNNTKQIARLVTFDVMRTQEAMLQTEALAKRYNFANTQVIFAHASLAPVVVSDVILQSHGATTIEYGHGALGDPMDIVAHARTQSSLRHVWTQAEARYYQPHAAQPVEGGHLPVAQALSTAPRQGAIKILVLSNYSHPILGFDGPAPRYEYQRLLFIALREALQGLDAELHWRPHPGDDEQAVLRTMNEFADLKPQRSLRASALQDDLAWSQVIISTISTTVVQALQAGGRPIFIHDIPFHEPTLNDLFDPSRRFVDGSSLRDKLHHEIAAPTRAPEAGLMTRLGAQSLND